MSSRAYFLFTSCFCFSDLRLHLPCLGLGMAASASALPWSPFALPRPRGGCLGPGLASPRFQLSLHRQICLGPCFCLEKMPWPYNTAYRSILTVLQVSYAVTFVTYIFLSNLAHYRRKSWLFLKEMFARNSNNLRKLMRAYTIVISVGA